MTDAKPTLVIADSPVNTVVMTQPPKAPKKPKSMAGKQQATCPVCDKSMRADNIMGSHMKVHVKQVPTFMNEAERVWAYDNKACLIYKSEQTKYCVSMAYCLICEKGAHNHNNAGDALVFFKSHSHTRAEREKAFETIKDVYAVDDAVREIATKKRAEVVEMRKAGVKSVTLSDTTMTLIDKHQIWDEEERGETLDVRLPKFIKAYDALYAENQKLKTSVATNEQVQHWKTKHSEMEDKFEDLKEEADDMRQYIERLEAEVKKLRAEGQPKKAPAKKTFDDEIALQITYLTDRITTVEADNLDARDASKEYYDMDVELDELLEKQFDNVLNGLYEIWKEFTSGVIDRDDYIAQSREYVDGLN